MNSRTYGPVGAYGMNSRSLTPEEIDVTLRGALRETLAQNVAEDRLVMIREVEAGNHTLRWEPDQEEIVIDNHDVTVHSRRDAFALAEALRLLADEAWPE